MKKSTMRWERKGGNYKERLQLFSSRDYRVRGDRIRWVSGQHPRARHRKEDESFMLISLFYLIVIIDTVCSTQRSDLHLIQKKKKVCEENEVSRMPGLPNGLAIWKSGRRWLVGSVIRFGAISLSSRWWMYNIHHSLVLFFFFRFFSSQRGKKRRKKKFLH